MGCRIHREILSLFGVGLCLLAGCGQTDAPAAAVPTNTDSAAKANIIRIPADSPQLREFHVVTVEQALMPADELVAPGRITINPNRVSRVLPPMSGRVLKVLAKFGDHVEQGQTVLTMDSADADAAVSALLQAQSTERQTKAALDKAETDLHRANELYAAQAIAEKDVLQARNDYASARSAYDIARTVREQAARKLALFELKPTEFQQVVQVRAPITGSVLEVNVAPGEYRAAISFHTDTTAPLMTIADLGSVWMAADVPEPFLRLIRVGDAVVINLVAFPDETFPGKVARIGDVLDAQTRTLKVYVELDNPAGRLRPEMFGTIRHSGPTRMTTVVPAVAVVEEYGRPVVFIERGPGQFERRQVTTGLRVGPRVVVAGVHPGDRVVADGAVLLKGL